MLMILWLMLFLQRPMVGPVIIISPSNITTPLTIKGSTNQVDNLMEWTDPDGVVQSFVGPNGQITGTFAITDPEPNALVYNDTNGVLKSILGTTFDPVTNEIGLFTSDPQAPIHLNALTLVTSPLHVNESGYGAVTVNDPQNLALWNVSTARVGGAMTANYAEYGFLTTMLGKVTTAGTGYTKASNMAYSVLDDPSDYVLGVCDTCRNLVSSQNQSWIGPSNLFGRVWGEYSSVSTLGGDGVLVGGEFQVLNTGTDPVDVDDPRYGKIGVISSAGGTENSGVGYYLTSIDSRTWHKGIFSRDTAIGSDVGDGFIELDDDDSQLFRVKSTGQTLVGNLEHAADTGDYDLTSYGYLTSSSYFTVAGGTDDKEILYFFVDSITSKNRIGSTRYDSGVAYWPLTLETGGNEVLKATTDPFVQITTSYGGSNVSEAGTVALRNNSGALEMSENAGAWTAIGSGGGGGSSQVANGRLTYATGYPVYNPIPSTPSSTDTGAETVDFAANDGWLNGTIISPSATGGGLTRGTVYYVHVVDANTISFHTTVAGAFAGSSPVNLTANVTSDLQVFGISSATLYYTPYKGNQIWLYGGSWVGFDLTELSIPLGTLVSATNYDVFIYDSGGLTSELVAWSSATARATELVLQDGVYVQNGDTSRRYVGTIRTTSTTTGEDSSLKRFTWNMDNRLARSMRSIQEVQDSSTYSTFAFRQAGAAASNRLEMVLGLNEDQLSAQVNESGSVTSTSVSGAVGIGIDSTTVNSPDTVTGMAVNGGAAIFSSFIASWRGILSPGYHALNWLETGTGSATMTWIYVQANIYALSGIRGTIFS